MFKQDQQSRIVCVMRPLVTRWPWKMLENTSGFVSQFDSKNPAIGCPPLIAHYASTNLVCGDQAQWVEGIIWPGFICFKKQKNTVCRKKKRTKMTSSL